jgi:3-oxoadipate enol-lactonase
MIICYLISTMMTSFSIAFHSGYMHVKIMNRMNIQQIRIQTMMTDRSISYISVYDVDNQLRRVRVYDSKSEHCTTTTPYPPLILLGGTAQTISTFSPHFKHIAKSRRLILPELRCQGQTELLSRNGTISQHISDFELILKELNVTEKVDIAGFSFGGRIGLAIAAYRPHLVSRLSITGVPLIRPKLGSLILQSWLEGIPSEFKTCAWSFVLNGYSQRFLEQYYHRLPKFVDMIMESNDPDKLADLLKLSHVHDDDDFSVKSCAKKITCSVQVIGSLEDRISGFKEVKDLAGLLVSSSFAEINTGHLAPFEDPITWRRLVLDYFNDNHDDYRM